MGRLVGALVMGVARRRWAVALLIGLLCLGGGRVLRSNARDWSRTEPDTFPASRTARSLDADRFEAYREDGMWLMVFGFVVCVLAVAAWVWRDPPPAPTTGPPDRSDAPF